jgi:hypothetical protein
MQGWRRGWLVIAASIGCGACTAPPAGESAGAPSLSSDDAAIATQLYAGTPRTPAGFLSDPAPASFEQVTTYQVKSRQLSPAAPTQHELCTDDWIEALGWSETLALAAPTYLDLVGNETTERYYELDRVPQGDPQHYERIRVFRCSYLDRSGVDLDGSDGFAGTFNHRPLDAASLRDLAEYLWRFSEYNNTDHSVVASAGQTTTSGLAHTLTLASLERGTSCDRVVLTDWTHTVDAATGALGSTSTELREFSVRRDGDTVQGC